MSFVRTVLGYHDRCLGPFLLEPFADDLVSRLEAGPGSCVLELACGTGIVTARLREALPATTQIVATDVSELMIEIARIKLAGADVHWRTADASALPFKNATFDSVVCQFGFMFFPDLAVALSEVRRVLRPGGTLLANVWCALDENPSAAIAHAVLSRMFEDDPPPFLRVRFGSISATALQELPRQCGFASVAVTRVALSGHAASARIVAEGLVKGSPLSFELAARQADLDAVARAVEQALTGHGGHPFRSPLAALVLSAS